jgi:hypothetical protein
MENQNWQNQEREADGRFGPSLEVAEAPRRRKTKDRLAGGTPLDTKKNLQALATVIEAEAKGLSARCRPSRDGR